MTGPHPHRLRSRRRTALLVGAFLALGPSILAACGVEATDDLADDRTTTEPTDPTTTTAEEDPTTTTEPAPPPVVLELRPVLDVTTAEDGCRPNGLLPGQPAPPATTTPTFATTTTVPLPTTTAPRPTGPSFPDQDDFLCYVVGPVGLTGDDLDTATASDSDVNGWVVDVTVSSGSVAAANELFNACADAAATCPGLVDSPDAGRVAILVDDVVVSAPAVRSRNLGDDSITISGDFTEAEAEDLAASLGG